MKISLIIATINRVQEVKELLDSVMNSNYEKNKIEIIVVDQNIEKDLTEIIAKYTFLNIKHIKSSEKGLSKNRNIGIEVSTGEIICFPDDDCKFLNDTIFNVIEEFKKNMKLEILMGRIIDENGKDCIRKWPKKECKITKRNFYLRNSSITMFKRNTKKEYYDEEFGVGSKYGSCEDADFLFRMLKKKSLIEYNPDIVMFHPSFKGKITAEKAKKYGEGFGSFCRKNICLDIIILYLMSQFLFLLRVINYYFKNKEEYEIAKSGFIGRIKGFFYFLKK
ncbi:glycosyltransferase family 2 protein [Cetobacterium somerae]|uniref:glycosyltransferase family 2 protein n=1 Tax=Cetobacterium somerae TaxID=188913 RepID=UPI002E7B9F28|nr:glycosyltransferase family 2 protein [Cetobacterium somerae]WVJ00703.1 glycosyltransferase family 2 protein [Cetobacterium somerae]